MYPLTLQLRNKCVVVIGGGAIAHFKIVPLVREGARVTVVSPEAHAAVQKLAEQGSITWVQAEYDKRYIADALLIIAATDDAVLNEQIASDADERQLVNVITNPDIGNVHLPAALQRGRLMIAVSTGGASPKLAKHIRSELANIYDESYEDYMEFLYECRVKVKRSGYEKVARNKLLQEALDPVYRACKEKRTQFLERL